MNPVISSIGTKRWYNDFGEYHRENGPAIEWVNGSKEWYIDDNRHRLDGPAVESYPSSARKPRPLGRG
jgi:hypothetical protein